MPPTSLDKPTEITISNGGGGGNVYEDIDVLRNSAGFVAFFSQRRRDGVITYAIVRKYQRFDDKTRAVAESQTSYMTEGIASDHLEFMRLVLEHLEKLKAKREAGELPYPVDGDRAAHRRRA